MKYINVKTQAVKTEAQIRAENPNTSYPRPFPVPEGYAAVFDTPAPSVTLLQRAQITAPAITSKGSYEWQWEVVDKYTDYTDADGVAVSKAEQEAAAVASDKMTKAKAAVELSKQTGVEILGVLCSATKDDQNGLTAVAMGVTLARMSLTTFPDTVFEFSNGNTLTITDSNFNDIYAAWVPFRQSFFATS